MSHLTQSLLNTFKRHALRVMFLLSMALCCGFSGKFLIAEYYFHQAQQLVTSASFDFDSQLPSALALLDKSLALRAAHPLVVDYKAGLLYSALVRRPNADTRTELIELYQRSIALRGHWPLSSARLARVYGLDDGELEEGFFTAFDQVFDQALYERYGATLLLEVALQNWYRLPDDYRDKVITLMDVALQSKANSTFTLKTWLDDAYLLGWFCQQIQPTARAHEMCTR